VGQYNLPGRLPPNCHTPSVGGPLEQHRPDMKGQQYAKHRFLGGLYLARELNIVSPVLDCGYNCTCVAWIYLLHSTPYEKNHPHGGFELRYSSIAPFKSLSQITTHKNCRTNANPGTRKFEEYAH